MSTAVPSTINITAAQGEALQALQAALARANESGLLDSMAPSLSHPIVSREMIKETMPVQRDAARMTGYTVHAPTEGSDGWAFCFEGDYSGEHPSESAAWDAAVFDMDSNRFWDVVVPYYGLDTSFDYNANPKLIRDYVADYDRQQTMLPSANTASEALQGLPINESRTLKYYIAVEVEAAGPISDLATSLQRAYDGGAAGDFQVLVTHAPTYIVVFERNAADDAEYVSKRAQTPDMSIEKAVMQQLAAELADGDAGAVAQPVIDVLNEGDAQCFDYGVGAFEAMAKFKPETESHKGREMAAKPVAKASDSSPSP